MSDQIMTQFVRFPQIRVFNKSNINQLFTYSDNQKKTEVGRRRHYSYTRKMRGEKCLKSSIFPNIPPFIVNLPTINQQEIGKNTENVPEPPELRTIDMMVELRESLWRIPLAFLEIVRIHELKTKDRPVFGANVAIPKTFTKDKTNHVKKSYSKPKSMITDEKVLMVRSEVPRVPKVPGFFRQNTKDQSSFSDDHGGVKVSPFPACTQISRKDNLWVHFKMMQDKYGTKEFNFLSDSYNLPGHRVEIERRMGLEPGSLWIIKPLGRNNGTGIRVINSLVDLPGYDEEVCVQRYIENPYLIHNKKFDLRIYVLLTSLDPLRIYIYDEGLVRFATEKYSLDTAVLSNSRVHVTNYAINKDSDKFVINTSPDLPTGNKWSLSSLWRYLSEHSSNTARLDTFQVWSDIQDIVIKSIFCGLDSIR
ncbi:tubulin polyglutamylase TTLL7 isoform X2 [Eurytemora carolleeae]|uniref:tubulin polyglutamylase TTLL7 isoform X2 n=1 Tax=Eurytemora carolleeae TaxID=1294199 RepID=UPI000C772E68|nr:tubulin polyglutamylase TTLL7 isoform X2 [Eurytemora carolleeae]|eukprot:XP_023329624.1 tubulin polyglutamylase TTLL7-like isoform X2 [Eurytemora affinis]